MLGSWEVEVGIICHLANDPEDRYITVIRPTISLCVVRMALLVARLAFVC